MKLFLSWYRIHNAMMIEISDTGFAKNGSCGGFEGTSKRRGCAIPAGRCVARVRTPLRLRLDASAVYICAVGSCARAFFINKASGKAYYAWANWAVWHALYLLGHAASFNSPGGVYENRKRRRSLAIAFHSATLFTEAKGHAAIYSKRQHKHMHSFHFRRRTRAKLVNHRPMHAWVYR